MKKKIQTVDPLLYDKLYKFSKLQAYTNAEVAIKYYENIVQNIVDILNSDGDYQDKYYAIRETMKACCCYGRETHYNFILKKLIVEI